MNRDTISMYFVGAAVARLSVDARRRTLASAGIPEELLGAPHARVPAASFAALWLAVARELDDEFFGLDGRRMKAGSFALICHGALYSADLGRALKSTLRSFALFLDDIAAELRLETDEAVISLADRIAAPEDRRFAEETLLVLIHGLACWLVGRRIALSQATFSYPRPAHAAEYVAMYSNHLRFDAPTTSLRFDARLLDAPVVQDARTLSRFLREAPQSVFLKYRNDAGWSARLRRRLRLCVGKAEWPALDELADEFHVAPTTLRRRLDAEGTSYKQVKEGLRRDAAIDLLAGSRRSIAEIATLVGFDEPSAFHRAFKRWTGVQPGEYRRRVSSSA